MTVAFDTAAAQDLFDRIQSHALALGVYDVVNTHEARSAPGQGIQAALWVDYIGPFPPGSGLGATTGLVALLCRSYSSMYQAPLDQVDPNLLGAVSAFMGALTGDLDLGGTVRNIDLMGMSGRRLETQAGYVEIDKKLYRCLDLRIPVIVNDMWTMGV